MCVARAAALSAHTAVTDRTPRTCEQRDSSNIRLSQSVLDDSHHHPECDCGNSSIDHTEVAARCHSSVLIYWLLTFLL